MANQAAAAEPGQPATLRDTINQADTSVEANPAMQAVQSNVNATYLDDAFATPTGLFNPIAVQKLAQKARGGTMTGFRDNAAFVGILSTQLWHQQFATGNKTTLTENAA